MMTTRSPPLLDSPQRLDCANGSTRCSYSLSDAAKRSFSAPRRFRCHICGRVPLNSRYWLAVTCGLCERNRQTALHPRFRFPQVTGFYWRDANLLFQDKTFFLITFGTCFFEIKTGMLARIKSSSFVHTCQLRSQKDWPSWWILKQSGCFVTSVVVNNLPQTGMAATSSTRHGHQARTPLHSGRTMLPEQRGFPRRRVTMLPIRITRAKQLLAFNPLFVCGRSIM